MLAVLSSVEICIPKPCCKHKMQPLSERRPTIVSNYDVQLFGQSSPWLWLPYHTYLFLLLVGLGIINNYSIQWGVWLF
jgi:hypothetical protein